MSKSDFTADNQKQYQHVVQNSDKVFTVLTNTDLVLPCMIVAKQDHKIFPEINTH